LKYDAQNLSHLRHLQPFCFFKVSLTLVRDDSNFVFQNVNFLTYVDPLITFIVALILGFFWGHGWKA